MSAYTDKLENAIIAAHESGDTEGAQILANELKAWNPKADASNVKNQTPNSIGRQLGLTARYIGEGLADTGGMFTDPFVGVANRALGTNINSLRGATTNILDTMGLPSPQTSRERVVGDASRMMAGTGGFVGAAKIAAKYTPQVTAEVLKSIAARPDLQAGSAAGAGLSGGEAREQGASPLVQGLASLFGGLAIPAAQTVAESTVNFGKNLVNSKFSNTQKVDQVIQQAGIDTANIPTQSLNSLRDDVKKALKTGGSLSPDAVRRLADYKALGATPLRGNLTLNPVDITKDKNLTKLAANSDDLVANQLPMIPNRNNSALITGLNDLGANTAEDAYSAGSTIMGALDRRNTGAKSVINNLYKNAKDSNGRNIQLDRSLFNETAINNLVQENKIAFLPPEIKSMMNNIAKGEVVIDGVKHDVPFDVNSIDNLKTILASSSQSPDGNVRAAVKIVRDALDNTQPVSGVSGDAMKAFDKARAVNRAYMQIVEKTPALQAVRDGIEPDKFVQQFILGTGQKSNVMDVAMLKNSIKNSPEALQSVRGQILTHLKSKGVNGAADEVANFSPAGYNKALEQIGDRKLKLFFEPKEIEQLKRIGRVASYENFQPKGSAVNNSNTGAALFTSVIDKIDKYIPFGNVAIGKPVKNMMVNSQVKATLDPSQSLISQAINNNQKRNLPIFPLIAGLGTLSTE
jgi:hypothetical protein